MLALKTWRERLLGGQLKGILEDCLQLPDQNSSVQNRFQDLLAGFGRSFSASEDTEVACFSAPGRTEIVGNHTDHQLGEVLAASVTLDIWALARPNNSSVLRFQSAGWPLVEVDCNDLSVHPEEEGTTAALLRGVAAGITERGHKAVGLDIYCQSEVLPGSGLSSSAACEVLLALICSHFWGAKELGPTDWAIIGQYAENKYFGKPSGLMDQLASATGAAVHIDFEKPAEPKIEALPLSLAKEGYALCIVDSGADHADLTAAYASIPEEMHKVAKALGKEKLREISPAAFFKALLELRKSCGDRAVLRAWHFFRENERVERASKALQEGKFSDFLTAVRESGLSSWRLLQNITPDGSIHEQALAVALAAAEEALGGEGACRVHGGGFAGTIQAFVPQSRIQSFVEQMEAVLGEGRCHVLSVRPVGAVVFPE